MSDERFPSIKQGDTWPQETFVYEEAAGVRGDLTGAVITRTLKLSPDARAVALTLSSTSGGFEITDAVNGVFRRPELPLTIPPGDYYFDTEIRFTGGRVETFPPGESYCRIKVTPSPT